MRKAPIKLIQKMPNVANSRNLPFSILLIPLAILRDASCRAWVLLKIEKMKLRIPKHEVDRKMTKHELKARYKRCFCQNLGEGWGWWIEGE
jgi:hypothetical protein